MGFIRVKKQTEPATPPTGKTTIYVDIADNKLSIKDDTGAVTKFTVTSENFLDVEDILLNDQSTGILKGGIVSINGGDNTKFDFTALTLHIVDNFTDPENPVITKVEIAAQTAVTGTEVVTNFVTSIGIRLDNVAPTGGTSTAISATIDGVAGTVHITQKPDISYTNAETRDIVQIGAILHSQSIIEDTFNLQQIVPSIALQLYDLASAIGVFNISGNIFLANGANLNIDKSEGEIFRQGANNDGTIAGLKNPNVDFSSLASPATFTYSHRNGSGGFTLITGQTLIDPDNFDDGSGTLVAVGNNKFTIKKLYIGTDGFIGIEYGQVEFTKLSLAEGAVTDPTVVNPIATSNTSFRGWLIVEKGITDLTAAIIAGNAKFIEANRFSTAASGSSITGEVNTALNVGVSGQGIFKQKDGVTLEFKNINAGSSKVIITDDTGNDEIDIDIVPANILTSTLNNDAFLKKVGKETLWIPATAMTPATTNGAATGQIETSTNKINVETLDFDKDTDEFAHFNITLPKSWNLGTITYQLFWTTATGGTTGIAFALQGVAIGDNVTNDTAYGTAVVITDDAQTGANEIYVSAESAAITIANTPADDEVCFFRLFRDVSDANDDLAEDAQLIGIKFHFTLDAEDDA